MRLKQRGGNAMCKGPGVEMYIDHLEDRKETHVGKAGGEKSQILCRGL